MDNELPLLSPSLEARARQEYERARWRYAFGVAWFVVPLCGLCLFWCRQVWVCLGLGCALLGVSVLFRWYGRALGRAVLPGLGIGSTSFLLPSVFHVGQSCHMQACTPLCMAVCLGTGAVMGFLMSRWLSLHEGQRLASLGAVALVAGLTSTLGCLSLGLAAVSVFLISALLSTTTLTILTPQTH